MINAQVNPEFIVRAIGIPEMKPDDGIFDLIIISPEGAFKEKSVICG